MSAYVVAKPHIDALVTLAFDGPVGAVSGPDSAWYPVIDLTKTDLGQTLWTENVNSVNYRYSISEPPADYVYQPGRRLTVGEALLALDGYEYQACEHPEWRGSAAYTFIERLRHALIRYVPGYGTADTWSIS